MFASYFFDDIFSTLSHLFEHSEMLELGWNSEDYGLYTSGYSFLCIFGGLVICGMLLDKWGVRVTGSVFVGLMAGGAGLVTYAITAGYPPHISRFVAYIGCMIFGLGSEIAGVAVTRSIAKWFKHGPMAFAMGLQLAIARLGTATAFVLSPILVPSKDGVYSLSETARPAFFGLMLMFAGMILWAIFVSLDKYFDTKAETDIETGKKEGEFRFSDVLTLLTNKDYIALAFLCVFFYSSIIAFKKFASAILIPKFGVPVEDASWMISMLPFATVIFAPLFGILVDKIGKGTRWMLSGAVLALLAHLILAFAPTGNSIYGYLSMVFLGFAYSLVPAAMWPSVPKIVSEKVLGTAFALIYWLQNLGLFTFKLLSGKILEAHSSSADAVAGAFAVELMFVGICILALVITVYISMRKRIGETA